MSNPTISIIVAVYNTESYLDTCITSVINQTFKDWELILIDDGSTDSSGRICDEYAARESRIKVIHKSNGGQAESRNVGIHQAQGKYIGFVDSDDWIEPTMFERLYTSISDADADAAICERFEDYVGKSVPMHQDMVLGVVGHDEILMAQYYCYLLQVLWSTLFRKEVLTSDIPQKEFCEDFAILPHWFNNVNKAVVIDEPLYHYRMRKGSLMHINKSIQRKLIELQLMRERSRYIKSLRIAPDSDIDAFEAHHYYDIAKSYARNYSGEERQAIVEKCHQMLQQMSPYDIHGTRARTRLRIRLLTKSSFWFIMLMRLSNMFSFHKKSRQELIPYQLYD